MLTHSNTRSLTLTNSADAPGQSAGERGILLGALESTGAGAPRLLLL